MRPGEAAFVMMLGGLAISYLEFLRPGTILPGVVGGVLFFLGVARMWDQPSGIAALLLMVIAFLCLPLGVLLKQAPLACVPAAVIFIYAGREAGNRLWITLAAILPFVPLTAWLLAIAWKARVAKLSI